MQTDFWSRLAFGVHVLVAGQDPDRLLGVRDGFRRYLGEGMGLPTEVRLEGRPADDGRDALPLDDAGILALARDRARELPEEGDFRVGSEAGLLSLGSDGGERWLVRTWVVIGLGEETWGSSGSLQLPRQLMDGPEASERPVQVPGALRRGGMVASLTGGLESRRDAIALSTLHALATLFYPRAEAARRRGPGASPGRAPGPR